MTDKPPAPDGSAAARNAEGNPVFRMMGLPRLSRIKLPSRNWLIFLSIVGSWTSLLIYDRYHKRRIQRKWSGFVAHLANEEIAASQLQRRITIMLAAPPGDGLRVSREHFHEYIKPILVAGALDWEVIEGRREGEVRAGLAEKIRKLRERNGEERKHEEDEGISPDDAVRMVRHGMRVKDWEGVKGDLVVGRHVWKEYIRGLHEGWLGPIDSPAQPEPQTPEPAQADPDFPDAQTPEEKEKEKEEEKNKKEEKPVEKATPTPPFISPSDYSTALPSPTIPDVFPPSTAVPLPHILGIRNTPVRMYRFLNRRKVADETGASIAALVLASQSRPYTQAISAAASSSLLEDISTNDTPPANDPSLNLPQTSTAASSATWEQESTLKEAEPEWHKSARKPNPEGDTRERVWKEDMVIDPRIGARMRTFELPPGARKAAEELEERTRREKRPMWKEVVEWAGYGKKEKQGWEMGFEGSEGA